jgi:hypothetical protein
MSPAVIVIIVGFAIIGAGIYFELNSMASYGVTMSSHGNGGTGKLDGKGMTFCGIIVTGFGFVMKQKNHENDSA